MEEFERLINDIDEFGEWPDFEMDASESDEAAYLEYA
jgi:hypothetical protein